MKILLITICAYVLSISFIQLLHAIAKCFNAMKLGMTIAITSQIVMCLWNIAFRDNIHPSLFWAVFVILTINIIVGLCFFAKSIFKNSAR